MNLSKSLVVVAVVSLAALCVPAGAADWNSVSAAVEARAEGRARAAELRSALDARTVNAPLHDLWKKMNASEGPERLIAAWSILKSCPDGDVSRWNEIGYLDIPSMMPRPLMVIDGLYAALEELSRNESGVWLGAELLKDFSKSSMGRYDFLLTCPASVADAVAVIAEKTDLVGNWNVRKTVGTTPVARAIRGTISMDSAMSSGMQFLDGAGVPANNGFYAWDRSTGRIYNVSDNERYRKN